MCSVVLLVACGSERVVSPSSEVSSPTLPRVSPTAYDLQVRYVGDEATPRLREAVQRATSRWSQIIVNDIGSTALTATAGECEPWLPAISETINDLIVFVRATKIDGPNKAVARAGPCYVSGVSRLPIVGTLEVDIDDLDTLAQRDLLDNVVLHELGHVLGLGTLWNYRRSLIVGSGTDDPFFNGTSARAAFLAVGGAQYQGTPVPVENSGMLGTRDSHWRASVFGNELMQGFVQAGGMPLSAVTIASLADLGYSVSLSAADQFPHLSTLRAVVSSEVTDDKISLSGDVTRGPIFEIDRAGARRRIRPD